MKNVNIKVVVDTGSADAEVNSLDNSLDALGNTATSTSSKTGKLGNTIKSSKGGMDSLSKSAKLAANAETQMGNAAATASTKVTKLANTTGQANNAVVEMGRVASDAQYGLRGMGNNISQLATQIFQLMATEDQSTKARQANTTATKASAITTKTAATASKGATTAIAAQSVATEVATKKTLGFVGAMKTIGTAMTGPLGLLFLLQGVITAVTWYFTTVDDAAESTDEFTDSMKELAKQTNDNYLSQEDLNRAIGTYIDRSYEMATITLEQGRVNNDAATALALYNEKVKEVAKHEKELAERKYFRSGIEGLLTKAIKEASNAMIEYDALIAESIRLENERTDLKNKANAANVGSLKALQQQLTEEKKKQTAVSTTAEEYKKLGEAVAATQKKIDDITGKKKKKGNGNSESAIARIKKNIDTEIALQADKNKTMEQAELDASERKYDKLAEDAKKYGYKTEEIEAARLQAIAIITNNYILLAEEQEIEGNQRKNDLALNQQQWEDENLSDPYEKYLAKAETIELEMEQLATKYLDEQELYKDDKDKLLELEADYLDESQELKQKAADLIIKRDEKTAERELEIQEAYEDAVQDLKEASWDAAEGGFNLLARLSGENKALQAVAIVGENAVAIARVVTDTVATNKVLSSTALIETAKGAAAKAAGNIPGAIAHDLAATTAGTSIAANNVQAVVSIASPVGAAATGLAALGESGNLSGGTVPDSGGGEVAAPSFNLVQGSEGNQIQQSIQGAGDVPVRAYVVAQDVTSQQSLDRQIESNSGL